MGRMLEMARRAERESRAARHAEEDAPTATPRPRVRGLREPAVAAPTAETVEVRGAPREVQLTAFQSILAEHGPRPGLGILWFRQLRSEVGPSEALEIATGVYRRSLCRVVPASARGANGDPFGLRWIDDGCAPPDGWTVDPTRTLFAGTRRQCSAWIEGGDALVRAPYTAVETEVPRRGR